MKGQKYLILMVGLLGIHSENIEIDPELITKSCVSMSEFINSEENKFGEKGIKEVLEELKAVDGEYQVVDYQGKKGSLVTYELTPDN